MKLKERSKMKKLIAIVLGIALLSPAPAQAALGEFKNYTFGDAKTNVSITPTVIQKDGPYLFQIRIDNSKDDVRMAYVSLFDCNRRLINYHRFYVGGESSFGNNIAGWQDDETNTFGKGRQYITRTIQFRYARAFATDCYRNYNSLQVVLWHTNMDNRTDATRFVPGTYAVNTFKVPFGQPFIMELDTTVPVWTDYQKTATDGLGSVSSSMQKHLDEINAITKAWEAAAKALQENQRIQAEIKAKAEAEALEKAKAEAVAKVKAEAEAKAKAEAELKAKQEALALLREQNREQQIKNELIRQEFLKEQEKSLRKFIGKPCKTLQKFKENEAGYLECINKKGKKVWGYLSLYN